MPHDNVIIHTRDGHCPAHVLTPSGPGPWPATIFYMDAGGIRPVEVEMAQRLADSGYLVVLPDLFYRFGPYPTLVPKEVFKGDWRVILGPLLATTNAIKAAEDTQAILAYLDTRTDVAGSKLGAMGFCMGGGMAIVSAGTHPERFAAVASFHGGNLANDTPTSPHLFVSKVKAEVYIASADNDASYPPQMAARLEQALRDAGTVYSTEQYSGATHGWMMPDFPVYDAVAAERGWKNLLALFARNLPG